MNLNQIALYKGLLCGCALSLSSNSKATSMALPQTTAMASLLFATLLITATTTASALNKLSDLIEPTWGNQNVIYQGDLVQLKLDRNSGAGFGSKSKFMYGKATIEMKLIEGDSAGTVTAFYMASEGPYHNEFDFEFLGNASGEPYLVQTNLYVNGFGNREQRMSLWFDPTKDFHSYSIIWTKHYVMFMVDETVVRIQYNMENLELGMGQTMGVYSSIWSAEEWATQGGLLKTEWAHSPFVASLRALHVDACPCPIPSAAVDNMRRCAAHPSSVGGPLSLHAVHQLRWVRSNHLVYDYCADAARFPTQPPECLRHSHLV